LPSSREPKANAVLVVLFFGGSDLGGRDRHSSGSASFVLRFDDYLTRVWQIN